MRLRFNEVKQAKGARQGAQPSQQQQLLLLQQQHNRNRQKFFRAPLQRCQNATAQPKKSLGVGPKLLIFCNDLNSFNIRISLYY